MADISKITDINGNTYNIKDTVARTGTIETSRLARPVKLNGVLDVTVVPQIDDLRANRLAFLPADQIIIEKTTDGGTTWVDAGVADSVKKGLFSQTRNSITIPLLNGEKNILCGLRVTFTAMKYNVPSGTAETQKYNYWNSSYVITTERYNQLREMYFWVSSNTDSIKVKLERATGAKPNNWVVLFDRSDYGMTGWGGNDYISFSQGAFGGGINQTGNYWNYRLTFFTAGPGGSNTLSGTSPTAAQNIAEIRGYGTTWWLAGNKFAASDHMYTWNTNQDVTFPQKVTATGGFSGNLTGNVTGNVSGKVNNHTVDSDVPANAKFTDTTYSNATTSAAGLMSSTDKTKLNGVAEGATAVEVVNSLTDTSTVKALSAAKGKDLNDQKASKADPVFTGSISMGRNSTSTVGTASVAVGSGVIASGNYAHAEGNGTEANGDSSHVEGLWSIANGKYSHAEGLGTVANGQASHVGGINNIPDSFDDWPEWVANTSYSVGDKVKRTVTSGGNTTVTGYKCATANSDSTFISSKWVSQLQMNYAEIIGNGSGNTFSNARVLDWDGNEHLMGDVYVHCNADSSGGVKLAPIPVAPSTNGTYFLQCVVTNGIPTYSWVSIPAANGVSF